MATLLMVALEVGLFVALLLTIELAYRATRARTRPPPAGPSAGAVTGVVFSLLALVLAFSYSDAADRLEMHRNLVVEEANTIGNVWFRIDIMQAEQQGPLRDLLRRYLDARIDAHAALPEIAEFERHRAEGERLRDEIWTRMVAAVARAEELDDVLLLPPVLEMGNVAAKRTLAVRTHLISPAFGFMFLLALVGAMLVGVTTAAGEARNWPYRLVFVIVVSTAIHVVIDMEFPRTGIVRTKEADSLLLEVRDDMR
ncbi:MAG: hypothetical protein V4850_20950 [Myxococcota bacterium]